MSLLIKDSLFVQPVPTQTIFSQITTKFTDFTNKLFTKDSSPVHDMAKRIWKVYTDYKEQSQKPSALTIDHLYPKEDSASGDHELSILASALLHRCSISHEERWINEGEEQPEPWDGTIYVKDTGSSDGYSF